MSKMHAQRRQCERRSCDNPSCRGTKYGNRYLLNWQDTDSWLRQASAIRRPQHQAPCRAGAALARSQRQPPQVPKGRQCVNVSADDERTHPARWLLNSFPWPIVLKFVHSYSYSRSHSSPPRWSPPASQRVADAAPWDFPSSRDGPSDEQREA